MKKGRLTLALLTLMISVMPLSVIADPDITAVKSATDSTDGTNNNQETEDSTATSSESSAETEPSHDEKQKEETESSSTDSEDETHSQEQTSASSNDAVTTSETDTTSESEKETTDSTSTSTSESQELTKSAAAAVKQTSSVVSVNNVSGLKNALQNRDIKTINLLSDLHLGDSKLPVNHTVEIIGNGKTITYGATLKQMSADMGISFGADGISITVKNLKFGEESNNNAFTNANNPNGCVTQGLTSRQNCTLTLENVTYYSEKGTNICTFNDSSNKVIIMGSSFTVDNEYDNPHSPMIRAGQIEFKGGLTTISSSQNSRYGLFEGDNGVKVNVEEGASVEVNARKFLFGTYNGTSGPCALTLGNGSEFHYSQDKLERPNGSDQYYVIQNDLISITTGKNSVLSFDALKETITNPINANLGEGSITSFGAGGADLTGGLTNNACFGRGRDQQQRIVFTLKKIARLEFQNYYLSVNNKALKYGAIGGNNNLSGSINFSDTGYDVSYSKRGSFDGAILYQKRETSWTFNSEGIVSSDNDNYEANKEDLLKSSSITITKSDKQDGKLELVKVPDTLLWTGRTISESKGVLERNSDNNMEIGVEDSRENPTNWFVKATVAKENDFTDFSLVWKDESNSQAVELNGSTVLNKDSVKPVNNVYAKSWSHTEGVLLKSGKYLSIGDYSNKLTIQWTLYDTGNAD